MRNALMLVIKQIPTARAEDHPAVLARPPREASNFDLQTVPKGTGGTDVASPAIPLDLWPAAQPLDCVALGIPLDWDLGLLH